ncbi:MAG: WYL domain-containing protein [Clostridia bacterium]|nr:WYL domain-containing protein [Clostridia bacterium]
MARGTDQKQKTLLLLTFLWKKTDETHGVTMEQMLAFLSQKGISAERKSVYGDLQALRDAGFSVTYSRTDGYRLTNRLFSPAEIRLFVDAVQSSKFISEKTSGKLIQKLEQLSSERETASLQHAVLLRERVKTENESVLQTVDTIRRAMTDNKQISFRYFDWDVKKKKQYKHDGARYRVSPWALIWEDENYYLVAYDGAIFKHFRVDKMEALLPEKQPREGHEEAKGRFNAARYARKFFGMYGGETKYIKLRFCEELSGVLVDRFGQSVVLAPPINGWSETVVTAAVSPVFFAWVMQFGTRMQIVLPQDVRRDFYDFVRQIAQGEEEK